MINKILFNKNLPIPHLSFSIILSCLIISIPILFNNVLYAFLAANAGLVFPWQFLTSVFAHGPYPPLIIHLTLNLLTIFIFGVLIERLLGSSRIFVICLIVMFIISYFRYQTQVYDNGISVITPAFAPIAFFITIREIKRDGSKALSDPFIIMSLFLFLLIWIISPVYVSVVDSFIADINLHFLISTFAGILFLFFWKNEINTKLSKIDVNKGHISVFDKIARTLGYLITFINLLALIVVWITQF